MAKPTHIAISAFGIHGGGGRVLLDELLKAAGNRVSHLWADARVAGSLPPIAGEVYPVAPTVIARMSALHAAPARTSAREILLCFNSLPPLRRSPSRTVTYVHAPHFFGMSSGIDYGRRTARRLRFEQALFWMGSPNCDEFWVQTPTSASGLAERTRGKGQVRIVPFVDSVIGEACSPGAHSPRSGVFFYPADGVGHKNHPNLLRAWAILASENIDARLVLTLGPEVYAQKLALAGLAHDDLKNVEAVGQLPRSQVMQTMKAADALIFPSLAETLGLPMLEAAVNSIPILASEREFVRDVCAPAESFDPASPRSIADAVRRFLGWPRSLISPLGAEAFVDALLA